MEDEEKDQPIDEAQADPKDDASKEGKRQSLRKRKPLGPVVKPLSKEEIEQLLRDPEIKERDNLLDAMPKGYDTDYQDEF
jgi:hypothetical protein